MDIDTLRAGWLSREQKENISVGGWFTTLLSNSIANPRDNYTKDHYFFVLYPQTHPLSLIICAARDPRRVSITIPM